ncbi:uncharacterized protein BDR25DRAFT_111038 [Lindgomyces ingoldianus]|uniref:Uncharacterized protein n=1 Tax=Lindgomyces ingoldianus TaxID=673940 RepID=A0ACB6R5W7_9PLEO|nr:uncharacterized protein BDR25DRAFT_111038 [Lindgomyces ingoldianus]KAF2474678.1 hypothetical protein BDR25DRAFT_111038 [Lindgomyces ingoldianus]
MAQHAPMLTLPPSSLHRISQIQSANLSLISAFESHPTFSSQHSSRQGKIYFMWDFAKRTDAMFQSLMHSYAQPDTPATRGSVPDLPPARMTEEQSGELKEDVVGRCVMLWTMITDGSGKTGVMFGEVEGQEVDLGEDVRAKAEVVRRVIFEEV